MPQVANTRVDLGVMRFLQIEWHNHERARNAWDIERAEMKAKIAKLEGDGRHSKKTNEQLERQIRMLEMALKNERAKNRGAQSGDNDKAINGNGGHPVKRAHPSPFDPPFRPRLTQII